MWIKPKLLTIGKNIETRSQWWLKHLWSEHASCLRKKSK